jgi:hypothetical protein
MAIAHHLKMNYVADTRYMTTGMLTFDPAKKWDNYLAFLELQKNPKIYTLPSTACNITINITKNDYPIITFSDLTDISGSNELPVISNTDNTTTSKNNNSNNIEISENCSRKVGKKEAKLDLSISNDNIECTKAILLRVRRMLPTSLYKMKIC